MSASASLVCIDPARVGEVWPLVRSMVLSAITRTGLSHSGDIEASILSGDSLLWITPASDGRSIEAAASTKLSLTDAEKVCVLVACGGTNRRRWLPLLAQIEAYAKAAGCSRVRIFGRRGWARVLESYAVEHVVLERLL